MIDWTDARGASRASLLAPFLKPSTQVLAIYTTLESTSDNIANFCANPVTEICPLSFPTSMMPEETNKLDGALIEWRRSLMDDLSDHALRPKRWAMGHVERPGTRHHPDSPSKEAFAVIMAIGWESVEAHFKAKETDVYKNAIRPIRYKLLQTGPGFLKGEVLNMSHVRFQPC